MIIWRNFRNYQSHKTKGRSEPKDSERPLFFSFGGLRNVRSAFAVGRLRNHITGPFRRPQSARGVCQRLLPSECFSPRRLFRGKD